MSWDRRGKGEGGGECPGTGEGVSVQVSVLGQVREQVS